jgi:recombinational DNA repair protein RecT
MGDEIAHMGSLCPLKQHSVNTHSTLQHPKIKNKANQMVSQKRPIEIFNYFAIITNKTLQLSRR